MLRQPTASKNDNNSAALPFSSTNANVRDSVSSVHSSKTGTWNSHVDQRTLKNMNANLPQYSSQGSFFPSPTTNPMDDVPFVPNPTFDSVRNGIRGSTSPLASASSDPLVRSLNAVERVGQFLTSTEYRFHEERRQLKETSNGWATFE